MDTMQNFNSFVNPQDLENHGQGEFQDSFWQMRIDPNAFPPSFDVGVLPSTTDRTSRKQDSALDLTSFSSPGYPCIKTEDEFSSFVNTAQSTPTSNTPSPNDNFIFSNANSPGEFNRDQSQTSSPETCNDSLTNDTWPAIHIPQPVEQSNVSIALDKNKNRAETQIKTTVTMDPLSPHYQWIRFPRQNLAKPKQMASIEEAEANEKNNCTTRLHLTLVLATAVEKPDGLERAFRRARGDEPTPRRPRGVAITDIAKDDRCHPQNGGAVIICEGCKEREAKRFNRKKKREADDEKEWSSYEDDRIIMINEKEFKRWQDNDSPDYPVSAKKVEFVMRITCYCRHQEDKSPVGYRVIFTFKDVNDMVLAQEISEIVQITDDHKNKESPPEALSALTIPTGPHEAMPLQYAVPMSEYSPTVCSSQYSLPTTPIVPHTPGLPHSQSVFFPREAQYSRMMNSAAVTQAPNQNGMGFYGTAMPAPAPTQQYATHQRGQSYFSPTMLSPTGDQMPSQNGFPLHRPHSLDSFPQVFNFQFSPQPSYPQIYSSQPPSRATSRPASPTWDQGRGAKKMRAQPGFMLYEDFEE
ncbi:membrane-tethered transcription factor [Stemphylium lycopersici]|uniref:Membrane-tethered transcription factor n=1 Tax=Stemphylium lycopersici TaxID=183478 RepID=A0A364N0M9_STELY|nr:membrane-tethered transcription factor [Stemphylium lycopersici]RAR02717.1 membrane-tethered transcription factor [Stemphylium lycopersici]RAR08896.1 membrane-tethered transcription factor [Stemphylium lycopersici]